MKKLLVLIAVLSAITTFTLTTNARGGACSGHDGVNCSAGADKDGSVICMDGWKSSSVQYNTMKDVCGLDYVEEIAEETQPKNKGFEDMEQEHKNYDAVLFLKSKGIIGGYPDGTFQPEREINRAEFLKILVEGIGQKPDVSEYNECFIDVKNEWFAPYICYAKSIKWIDGYPDGSFKPAQTVNKVEAIKMLVNSQGVKAPETIDSSPFIDVPSGAWFAPFIYVAKDMGILEETGDYLLPDGNMKRASISENLYRAIKFIEENPDYNPTSPIESPSPQPTISQTTASSPSPQPTLSPTATPNPTDEALSEYQISQIIDQHCKKDWANDLSMLAYCKDEQNKALEDLEEAAPAYVTNDQLEIIKEECKKDWPTDFKMEAFCRNEQYQGVEDLDKVKPDYVSGDNNKIVVNSCAADWSRDYKMQSFCRNEQYEAIETLIQKPASTSCVYDWPTDFKMQVFCSQQ